VFASPHPFDIADNGLSPFMDVDVFNGDFLLPLSAVSIQGFKQSSVGCAILVRLIEIFFATFECLLRIHRPPITFHCSVMGCEQLGCQHAFQFVMSLYP
jgi:hypothetical protein